MAASNSESSPSDKNGSPKDELGNPLGSEYSLRIEGGSKYYDFVTAESYETLKAIIDRCHTAIGEDPASDDETLPDSIALIVREARERIAELERDLTEAKANADKLTMAWNAETARAEKAERALVAPSAEPASVDQLVEAYAEASAQHVRECGHCKGGAHIAGLKAVAGLPVSPSKEGAIERRLTELQKAVQYAVNRLDADDDQPQVSGDLAIALAYSNPPKRTLQKVCDVCGGRASACRILGHRPESDRNIQWQDSAPSSELTITQAAGESAGAQASGMECSRTAAPQEASGGPAGPAVSSELNNASAPGERKPGEIATLPNDTPRGGPGRQEQAQPAGGASEHALEDMPTDAVIRAICEYRGMDGGDKGDRADASGLWHAIRRASPSHEQQSFYERTAATAAIRRAEWDALKKCDCTDTTSCPGYYNCKRKKCAGNCILPGWVDFKCPTHGPGGSDERHAPPSAIRGNDK